MESRRVNIVVNNTIPNHTAVNTSKQLLTHISLATINQRNISLYKNQSFVPHFWLISHRLKP